MPNLTKTLFVGLLVLSLTTANAAQTAVVAPTPPSNVTFPTFTFVAGEGIFGGETIKGSPFTAEFTSENVQTLADGNRIVRRTNSTVYRDGEGRVRREQTFDQLGALAANGDVPRSISISDPVAGYSYSLNAKDKTARRTKLSKNSSVQVQTKDGKIIERRQVIVTVPNGGAPVIHGGVSGSGSSGSVFIAPPTPFGSGGYSTFYSTSNSAKFNSEQRVETLGTQNIEGVQAEGKRTVVTIPAGAIGNERPIETVHESWYSPELRTVVLSKNISPFVGEHTYKLTRLDKGEPSRTLFEVPSDYKVTDASSLFSFYFDRAGNYRDELLQKELQFRQLFPAPIPENGEKRVVPPNLH